MRKFLRLSEVLSFVGLRRSAWLARVSDGRAPPPTKIGSKIAVWPSDVIVQYQNDIIAHGEKTGTYSGRGEVL